MKDYGIIHRRKLARDIETHMLCKCCIADIRKGGKPVNMDVSELGVSVSSMTSSFACIFTIQCRQKLHSYTIEPSRRVIPSDDKETPPGQKKEDDP